MGQTDGLTLCETLRSSAATATLPVILLTALTGQIPRVAGLSAGANVFLTKPFDPIVLLGWVERLLTKTLDGCAVEG